MNTSNLTKYLAIGLAFAGTAHAYVLIDHFDSPTLGQDVAINNGNVGNSDSQQQTGLGDVAGGARNIYIKILACNPGTSQVSASANSSLSPHYFKFSNDIDSQSTCTITWDGFGGPQMNLDLSAETGMMLFSAHNDLAATYTMTLETVGTGVSTGIITAPSAFNGYLQFPWSAFAGSADLSNIDNITLTIDGGSGLDVRIDAIGTIPEPSTAGLAMLGIGAFGLARRRRN